LGGVGCGVEAGGVDGGQLETVEECGGSFGFDGVGGEGVDDYGDGELNGLAVFKGAEFEVAASVEVFAVGVVGAEAGVAGVETVMEVAPLASCEGWGVALQAVGLDVSADWVLLHSSLLGGAPRGLVVKSAMVAWT